MIHTIILFAYTRGYVTFSIKRELRRFICFLSSHASCTYVQMMFMLVLSNNLLNDLSDCAQLRVEENLDGLFHVVKHLFCEYVL